MMKNPFLYLFTVLLLAGCDKNDIATTFDIKKSNRVQFSSLQDGQQSFYIGYSADCAEADFKINWSGDTLSLRVVEKDGQLFFEESFTKFSYSYVEHNRTDSLVHPVYTNQTHILIPERAHSRLFYFFGNDTIKLDYLLKSRPQAYQSGCRLLLNGVPFEGEEIAYVDKFELGNGEILQQNRTVVSCVPNSIEEEAYLMYDINQLYLSHTYIHIEFAGKEAIQITGWQLIEN